MKGKIEKYNPKRIGMLSKNNYNNKLSSKKMKECQKTFLVLLGTFLILGIAGTVLNVWLNDPDKSGWGNKGETSREPSGGQQQSEEQREELIGGQRDEHGCLGPAGYQWCPSTEKCQRMWEEYCEEYKDQYRVEEEAKEGNEAGIGTVQGDVGENPPEYTAQWDIFESKDGHFQFQYPDQYETAIDKYGWPYSVVHLISKEGGQSYDVTFELWDSEQQAADEGRNPGAAEFFGMVENPFTDKFVSMTCWNPGTKSACEDIYATLVMKQ